MELKFGIELPLLAVFMKEKWTWPILQRLANLHIRLDV